MSNQTSATAERAKNYSAKQEELIINSAPLDLAKATAIAEQIGKTPRSVIAKALSLDVEYHSKKPEPKRVSQITKADLVIAISEELQGANLAGLEKATSASLANLLTVLYEIG